MIKPLDFVETSNGGIAMVTEMSPAGNGMGNRYSIRSIKRADGDYAAWWPESQLTYLGSLPLMLATELAHPFGNGAAPAKEIFGPDKNDKS